ncbi:hypothetical protein F5Y19DRAFT_385166 [Xylariaceae sp. FL1651]|nr:hypothetical protein F5Y19DRAFT_385166 [Xylariaceae sp. FL1651]
MEKLPDVEILVHIGAQSRAADDTRYRSLAAAYLAFEPTETAPLFPQSAFGDSSKDGEHGPDTQASQYPVAEDSESSLMLSNDGIGSFRSPQASFRSVVDNADSPQTRLGSGKLLSHANHEHTPAPATQASWQTPPSIVQDSHPMNHTTFTSLTSPTRVLENYLQHFESPSGSSKLGSQASGRAIAHGQTSQNTTNHIPVANLVPCTPDMIPCTPSAKSMSVSSSVGGDALEYQDRSDPQQQPEGRPDETADDNIIEETTFIASSQPSASTRADSEPPPKLRRHDLLMSSPRAFARAASDIGPKTASGRKASVTVTFLSSHGFTYESLEIQPPEPPTADLHIKPHELITTGLQNLARDVDLSARFRPEEQTRELRPYERGHWVLDCSSWEPQLKRDAWAFLANYMGTGRAGWGVWCKRDTEFREVRAYCWGSVVAHIYYVLWLSSQRKIVFTGSSWIDAEGNKVIIMGARDQPRR